MEADLEKVDRVMDLFMEYSERLATPAMISESTHVAYKYRL